MRIHFIAIGGAVMHNLAISLAEQGHQVTGSDDQIVEPSRSRLLKAGLLPAQLGWFSDKITEDIDAVILGMHAEENNPELKAAQELGIKIYSFPEFIHELSANKTRVVIAGTYGKTTIMSMVMHVLKALDRDFDYLVGAQLEGFDSLVKLTAHNKIILIEGDEYYASAIDHRSKFHLFHPNIALISGIDWNETRTNISKEDYLSLFDSFISTIVPKGTLIYNKDSAILRDIVEQTLDCKINRHGYKMPEYSINKGVTYLHNGEERIPLQVFGKLNLSNIAGAYTVCEWLGVKRTDFYKAIVSFQSSIRYLEFVASVNGSVVYQDFLFSPYKLRTSIHAVKEQFPGQGLVTIMELNPYDVLNENFLDQYASSMDESDHAVVLVNKDSIKDKNILLNTLESDIKQVFNHKNFVFLTDLNALEGYLESFKSLGFNLLFMVSPKHNTMNIVSFSDKFFKNF
ncbi:Mur ligase domain-containing protein [Sphingobacterium psychroaquaticum]|uniref:UDP-N-acetylmuramate: L-alanyl-gamma-D-glutamyl-meso-diaminopimelate ligase n=1 Tax=Sphingobacterium psychroaquaticum TaxID=561061 RepID=A0A1X7JPU6_9SPHI|nr:Mur ligase domain-containing protein [Sphingobacterium psychroaquaticum]QBQ40874.1 peptidoglycan synthetase [Sphingobacterium psychroaquaticum]SMG29519.1 UDP-N-acetylmuramate: L-alanyl-gamma-D-glutamyl-meso-diaminopimelate ligase [Sphingobacterium psychroaquaticum]